jgi:formylglycine-generating enzyme required for sulfatase activity
MHNGQPTGPQDLNTTEDGSYFLNGATSDLELMAVGRELDATWLIPSEDEWYKAAFHKNDGVTGNYFTYPTASDSTPSNTLTAPDPGNNANFDQDGYTIGAPYYFTVVGDFENSESPYGSFDQAGNVFEWNEGIITLNRVLRGGSFDQDGIRLPSTYRTAAAPTNETQSTGFRVSLIPEPGTIALLALGGLALIRRRRR